MIPNGTPYINYPPFANNGSKTPPGGSTESAKYALGMIPSDTFPAEWANYLFHGATEGVTRLNADAGSMKKEINNVLSEASITPDAQVNTQLYAAIKALANLTRTIISLTTSASERPAKTDVPFIPSVQDGLRISVKFTNGYYDPATNGFSFNLNNQGAKKIYVAKNGVLTEMQYHELTRDGVQRKWYIQPLTTLDLIYDSTLDSGAGGWLVEGNPVVLSAPSYTVYASGQIGDEATGTPKPWPSDNIPYGWLLCDGRALQQADYPDLYAELGVRYNLSTDSSDVFRLPDLRNRTIMGANPDVTGKADGNTSNVGDVQKAQLPSITGILDPRGPVSAGQNMGFPSATITKGSFKSYNQRNSRCMQYTDSVYNCFGIEINSSYNENGMQGSTDHLGENVYLDNGEVRSANIRMNWIIKY